MAHRTLHSHSSHWGVFDAEVENGEVVAVHPYPGDADPSAILANIPDSVRHPARITQPMVRAGWLDRGPGPDTHRGAEPFVPVDWATATDLLAAELRRVADEHGPQAIYGGSYGWASAGRFHHAQSQIHRFLNGLGGYTYSVHSYSLGAAEVIFPHVVGSFWDLVLRATAWPTIVENTEMFVCFGGLPLKNTAVKPGGVGKHRVREYLRRAKERGVEFVLFSPLQDDLPDFVQAEWHPLVPGSDVAVMLALAHTLITEGLHDTAFLDRYCVGFERFERYVLGKDDGQPKTPEWAARLSEVPAEEIRTLARRMAAHKTFITMSWSLQRTEYGEQAPWMGTTLAAMLGQIGLPSGGFGFGYSSTSMVGAAPLKFRFPSLSQGKNAVKTFIPVARIADMLLHPGEAFTYDGRNLTYPDIRLVYWCGGNPFHHHQHLSRLRRAFGRPDTIVVHDPFWTSMARNADIVLPCTMTLERNDIGWNENDSTLVAMRQAVAPHMQARSDYDIFADLSAKLGFADQFTEGRGEMDWLRHMYDTWRTTASEHGIDVPPFEGFWDEGYLEQTWSDNDEVLFGAFRADPERSPLSTPSGRIEIFSETIDRFGYADCPGHPTWLEPIEWLGGARAGQFPLQLIANNPSTRLHSQLDVGATSKGSKVQGREPIRMHPADAAARGIADGDVVRVFNDRGSCLAGAAISDAVRRSVAQLSTGAWYDPLDPGDLDAMCVHGNPNAVTMDKGTSSLAQGCSGQHVLVEIERWDGPVPDIKVHTPPPMQRREDLRS
ncbi:MAG TPA: molybdopterin guanine dinucleotide-containing S/N-oxide reductase [Ktedonobacterales bacterium]|nr:molybdopterin guanine dinucleotide-containing S/N-oxide reductase [Ktedonobacterales bacterium]